MFASSCRRSVPAVALIAGLAGCAGGQPPASGPLPQTAESATFSASRDNDAVPAGPDGGPRIFTANRDGGSVLAFSLRSSGDVTPRVKIAGSQTTLSEPDSLAIDAEGNIYAANDGANKVAIFRPDAQGNAKPKAIIAGSKTNLGPTEGLTIDPSGDLWVSDYSNNEITEYAPGAHGNAAPINTIGGGNTQLSTPVGMVMNGSGHLFVANAGAASIVVFAAGASGNATPIGIIEGNYTGLSRPFALAFDPNGRLLVADESAGVLVFNSGALGNVSPVQQITSLAYPAGVYGDAHGHIWAADFEGNSIDEFAGNANGNAKPIRAIKGPNTTLDGANYLALQ